jgi:GNAT superfamily N-acetyltransferase
MQAYIEKQLNLEQLTSELLNQDSLFYFARLDEEIVGYLKLNFNQAQKEEVLKGEAFEIERFYILKLYHRKGFGSQLFNKAIKIGKDKGYEQLWLGVWEHNKRALEFYVEKGLTPFSTHVFQLGQDTQTDILMQLKF